MDYTNVQHSSDYLDVLIWLETASEDEIVGAYWLATGSTKHDLQLGIQSLIDSDRPALANYFPELVIDALKLDDLSARFPECVLPVETLNDSLLRRARDPQYPFKGYGAVSAVINELKDRGKLTPGQSVLLAAELAALK